MKIKKIELIPVSSPLAYPLIMPNTHITAIHSVVLKMYMDDGTVAFSDSGDTSTWYRGEMQETIMGMIGQYIAPQVLLGEDPRNIEKLVGRMDLLFNENSQAKATVDFALHDAKGKAFDVPVYQLLGGRTAEYVRSGWVLSPGPVDEVIAKAKGALADGYELIKLKIGLPTVDEDIEMIKGVREAVGENVRMTVDANGFWNYETALYALRKLEDVGLESIEQPLPRWDIMGMARLRQQVSTPVYADEAAQDLHHIRELIERGAADGLFIKMQKAGGLLKAQRWLTLARLSGLPVHTGCMSGSGLEASPAIHLLVADQWGSQFVHENIGPPMNHGVFNTVDKPITDDIAANVPRFENGKTWPNEGPGFGIELNEEFIKEFQTPGKDIVVVE
jgi:L-alanine-DL-glutamate epimerase-like enolase superfamily enzyme